MKNECTQSLFNADQYLQAPIGINGTFSHKARKTRVSFRPVTQTSFERSPIAIHHSAIRDPRSTLRIVIRRLTNLLFPDTVIVLVGFYSFQVSTVLGSGQSRCGASDKHSSPLLLQHKRGGGFPVLILVKDCWIEGRRVPSDLLPSCHPFSFSESRSSKHEGGESGENCVSRRNQLASGGIL